MSDSEIDDLQNFESERQAELYKKAGLDRNNGEDDFEMSDEEVMAIEDSDQEEYYDNEANTEGKQKRGESWGASRDTYYGGADYEEDEEAFEDEEEEALKLQQQQAQELEEADFYDDDDMEGWSKDSKQPEALEEDIPDADFSSMKPKEIVAFIDENYPEVAGLAAELQELLETKNKFVEDDSPITEFQSMALNSYIGVIHVFFALFCEKARDGPVDLKEHPIMEGLIKARELWRVASSARDIEESEDDSEVASEVDVEVDAEVDAEVEDVDAEMSGSEMSGSEMSGYSDTEPESESEEEDDFSLNIPSLKSSKQKMDDYNETADTIEQAARAKNRQSLRFYTAQIDKKSGPKVDQSGGDVDLPYKERAFERRQRLMKDAQARGQEEKDTLGVSDDEGSAPVSNVKSNSVYEQVKQAKQTKKHAKKSRHEEALAAAKQGKLEEFLKANPDVDRRAINYQIQKNKGLTPYRKKENRNARVKKRVRYESAQKKLGSIRRVHKEQSGPYAGELSGIRKNLTHSTKFA